MKTSVRTLVTNQATRESHGARPTSWASGPAILVDKARGEPNDANTWVKVRGMIENFLTHKWREGALAGANTKEAFFVRNGLVTTMDAQDILEGRVNVETDMAVVDSAELVVLKFSQKIQAS